MITKTQNGSRTAGNESESLVTTIDTLESDRMTCSHLNPPPADTHADREPVSPCWPTRRALRVGATLRELRQGTYFGTGDTPLTVTHDGPIPRPLAQSILAACPPARDVHYLYVLSGPRGVVYVGQTWSPAARLAAHRKKSKFWGSVTEALILQHHFAGIWHSVDREAIEIERGLITELQPIFNLDRTLSEADRGSPWEHLLHEANRAATKRALQLLGRAG